MAHYTNKTTEKQSKELFSYMKHLDTRELDVNAPRANRPRAQSLCPTGTSRNHEHRRKSSSQFDLVSMHANNFLDVPNNDSDQEQDESSLSVDDFKTLMHRSSSFKNHKERQSGGIRRVRSFKTTSKGLVNRGDTFERRETSPTRSGHQTKPVDSTLHVFNNYVIPQLITTKVEEDQSYFKVLMTGARHVGKTSIIDQFMTSEFLCCGGRSIGKHFLIINVVFIITFIVKYMLCIYNTEISLVTRKISHVCMLV